MKRAHCLALLSVAVVVSSVGCAMRTPDGPRAGTYRPRAQAILDQWSDAVTAAGGSRGFVPVGELTGQIGDWELDVGGNNKIALMSGAVEVGTTLASVTPADGTVTWSDGTARNYPLMSAQQALAAVKAGGAGSCDGCTPLRVTSATLGSGAVETSRGPATAPVWEFAVEGTAVRVTRLAIADAARVVPPSPDPDPPAGIWISSASLGADPRLVTVAFTGAPEDAGGGCGADYTAEAVESDLAVVVIVLEHPKGFGFGACTAVGARRTAQVLLADPLGDRTVLDVITGQPVALDSSR